MLEELRERPRHFAEVAEMHMDIPWREFLRAWGEVRTSPVLGRHDNGLYTATAEGPAP
jgi:hypothetical protein